VFFKPTELSPYIKTNDRYSYDDLERIFEHTDVLVAPSIWYETFGFTVLEAMSFGVPVIVGGNVGAKDIIPNGAGIILEDISADKLYEAIQDLTPQRLEQMNQVICEKFEVPTMKHMSAQIMKLCYEGNNENS
jgi:glycosyltransferase involved in cell wall biosynthesis